MDTLGDLAILTVIAAFLTAIIEVIKAWVPKKYKDEYGLKFTWRKKKIVHIPSQAVWPVVSLILGVGVFLLLKYNIFGTDVPNQTAAAAVSGGVSSLGSNGVYRIKNLLGTATGGTSETNAQNTGPLAISIPEEIPEECGPYVENIEEVLLRGAEPIVTVVPINVPPAIPDVVAPVQPVPCVTEEKPIFIYQEDSALVF